MKRLMATVAGVLSALALSCTCRAETPDFLADVLTSDGVGHVDVEYAYKAGVTALVTCDFHIEGRGMGDRPTGLRDVGRSIFGFLHNSSRSISYFRFWGNGTSNSDYLQCWGNDYSIIKTQTLNASQDISLAIDYVAGKVAWDGETFSETLPAPASDSPLTYWVFSVNGNVAPTPFDLKSMKIYERVESANVAVRDLKPCFAQGRAALYDSVGEKVYYPTSKGFVLSGYDISLADGQALAVNAASCSPRTMTLSGGNALTFDGVHTLHSGTTVVLPQSGVTTVSLAKATGKGRYVLIDSLPSDFDLAAFRLGDVPTGFVGELSKDGANLILTISASGFFPDAMAGILKGDASGHVDTEYMYEYQKTSRVVFDFWSADRCRDGRSGNITRALFGFYQNGKAVSWWRFSGSESAEWDKLAYSCNAGLYSTNANKVVGNWLGDVRLVVDYANGKMSWDGGATMFDAPAPTVEATKTLWFFSINGLNNPAPVDFKELRIYEQVGQAAEETLVHDFVPAVHEGCPVAYDRVDKVLKVPTTSGFTARDLSYRLSVNGEVIYATGTVSVVAANASAVQGWMLTADSGRRIVARGSGSTATFDMPNEPATVRWVADAAVAAGAMLEIASDAGYSTLTLGNDATLSFAGDSCLYVATALVMPAGGSVNVSFGGANAPGCHVLVRGVADDLDLSGLTVASLPDGCCGALSRVGDALVLTVSRDPSGSSAIVAQTLRGDGVGYVDTGYFYTYSGAVKTSKVVADFHSANRGMGTAEIGDDVKIRSVFGYLNSSGEAGGSLSYVRFYGTGADASDQIQMWGDSYASASSVVSALPGLMKGNQSFVIDYANSTASYFGGESARELATPTKTSPKSIWILNVNGHNHPSAFDFRKMDIYETRSGSEVLAHRYVPALSGDDKAVAYDMVTKALILPTASALSVDFGTVRQEFFAVSTVSEGMPVGIPQFGVERTFTFVRDGSVTAKFGMSSMKLTRYDAAGEVLSEVLETSVAAGSTFAVALDGAASLVVTVAGPDYPSEKTVAQSFASVDVLGVAPSSFQKLRKHDCELAIPGPVTLTFNVDIAGIVADDYDEAGNLVGSSKVFGSARAGGSCDIAFGASAVRVLRISELGPGLRVIFR